MIKGIVNFRRVAVIQLSIFDHNAEPRQIEAIIDTGFNGALTLPPDTIEELGLNWRSRGSATLANGSEDYFDIFTGTVIWDGKQRRVMVESANTHPLVGMRLLHRHRLEVMVIPAGDVTIEALPR